MNNSYTHKKVYSMNERKSAYVLVRREHTEPAKALLWFLASGTTVIAALSIARLFW